MDEEALNRSLRKFLKHVGVTTQREIELAVRKAAAAGTLKGAALPVRATVTLEGTDLTLNIDGKIEVA